MALSHSPKIVTDGLITYLDAANKKSYSGTGTTWYDLSNHHNGAISGATYTSDDGGSFSFDGVNDTVRFGTGNTFFPLPEFSIEMWFRSLGTTATTGTSPGLMGMTYGMRSMVHSTTLNFGLDNGTSFTYITSPSTYNFYNGDWHHVIYQANATIRYLYIDGEYVGSRSDTWSGSTRWLTNTACIGRDNNNSMYYFTGNISNVKIYNKVLTSSEVKQNFNALRGRYNI